MREHKIIMLQDKQKEQATEGVTHLAIQRELRVLNDVSLLLLDELASSRNGSTIATHGFTEVQHLQQTFVADTRKNLGVR